ncbi:MAG: hypothetical protein ACUVQ6_00315 [Dissulfurimicrobium sp.]|uniref:hypothetical protein n=1 Tax=Dissulfurimicrobium sp. TaxID=2022436 RepID=UPI00404A0A7D
MFDSVGPVAVFDDALQGPDICLVLASVGVSAAQGSGCATVALPVYPELEMVF